MSLNEQELKAITLNWLRRTRLISKRTVLTCELPLRETSTRADLAFVRGRRIIGAEMKSDFDTLKRLDKQMKDYSSKFDTAILVVGSKHADKAINSKEKYENVYVIRADGGQLLDTEPLEFALRNSANPQNSASRRNLIEAFSLRFRSTSDEFWKEVAQRQINSTDLRLLSRYRKSREMQEKELAEQLDVWRRWEQALSLQS